MSHIRFKRKLLKLYMYELLLTLQMHFKVMRAPLSLEWTISTWLGVSHYKWY